MGRAGRCWEYKKKKMVDDLKLFHLSQRRRSQKLNDVVLCASEGKRDTAEGDSGVESVAVSMSQSGTPPRAPG